MRQMRCQNISCEEIQGRLEEYFDDEMDARRKSVVASHIETCENCQLEAQVVRTIKAAFQELPAPEPPPEIFNEVAAYVRANPNGRGWLQRGIERCRGLIDGSAYKQPLLRTAGLVCLVGVMLFGIYQHQRQQKIEKTSRDLHYALSKVQDVVERTGIVVNERLATVQIAETSRRALERKVNVSFAINRGLKTLNGSTGTILETERPQRSNKQGDTP